MSEEVTKIIDTLCEKLGVGASYLIPELAKKKIAQDIFMAMFLAIFVIIFTYLLVRCLKSESEFYLSDSVILLIGVFDFGFIFFLFSLLTDLVGWLASPTAMGVESIVNLIN